MSLNDIVSYIADIVTARAADGNNFGTVLIPEGLIEFIPEYKRLIRRTQRTPRRQQRQVAGMDEEASRVHPRTPLGRKRGRSANSPPT